MDDVTALRDALLDDISDPTRFDALPPDRVGHLRDRLDALIAAAARRAIEGSGVVEALDGLLDYPYILDAWGCRGCQQETGHSPTCPVGKALAVWSAVKMGTDRLRDAKVHEALAALPRPEEPRVDEGHEQRRSNAWRSINGLTPDARS